MLHHLYGGRSIGRRGGTFHPDTARVVMMIVRVTTTMGGLGCRTSRIIIDLVMIMNTRTVVVIIIITTTIVVVVVVVSFGHIFI